MAHFAQLDENNIVTQVIVVDNKDITDPHTGQEDEILGVALVIPAHLHPAVGAGIEKHMYLARSVTAQNDRLLPHF